MFLLTPSEKSRILEWWQCDKNFGARPAMFTAPSVLFEVEHGIPLRFFFLRKPGFHSLIFGDYSPKCKDTLKRNRKYIPVLEHSRSFSPPPAWAPSLMPTTSLAKNKFFLAPSWVACQDQHVVEMLNEPANNRQATRDPTHPRPPGIPHRRATKNPKG